MEIKKLFSDTWNDLFMGVVEDVQDPNKEYRIKVRVFSVHDDLELKYIPWAEPNNILIGGDETGGGNMSLPKKGAIVDVTFQNGNPYLPKWHTHARISRKLHSKISGMSANDYANATFLVYDTISNFYIYAIPSIGLVLKTLNDEDDGQIIYINNNNRSITVQNSLDDKIYIGDKKVDIESFKQRIVIDGNAKSILIESDSNVTVKTKEATIDAKNIKLGKSAAESVIKGDTFKILFDSHTHIGNLGAPCSPPVTPLSPIALSKVSKTE
jgi:hypothetical protein